VFTIGKDNPILPEHKRPLATISIFGLNCCESSPEKEKKNILQTK
jgi:hypothetical protein